ncbi:SusC/RagA family TonB-linked outer membrane protein [Fulvivirga sp. M361]|uniref:SusC/RagA family TonB-linked outer membrane protein n=1 Tax=Fulvivirga sp. M361 TaxID=2594266 RepID=UPI001179EF5E|nr:SusC/RagA family TonB-linked outer membrane protein [Fulvivirga sp. M361]TRX62208.1 SusC/RagA family TonB-linked outer membrane protein [Fulvivirga sp. M361]
MKKYLLLNFMLLLTVVSGDLWAQQRTISGKITSIEDGSTLPGVNVVLKGTTAGTVSDIDGNYSLSVPTGEGTLVFSFIGLQTEQVEIGERSVIDVQMSADVKQLSEVVVTAANIERQAKSLGYSVTSIDSEELLKARESNVVNSLQGKIAGVNIVSSGGSIGGSSRVLIRGAAALSSDIQPLFVVDGIPINNTNEQSIPGDGGDQRFANDFDYGNTAQDINPDDVETVTVLKGATAAALYGQRARNGAILITTKKGKNTKGKTSVTVNSSIRFDNVLRAPDLQSEYGPGTQGEVRENTRFSFGPRISGQELPEGNWLGLPGPLTAYEDNFTDFFETGQTLINSVAVSNGNEKTNFRLGYTSLLQKGIVPETELTRNSISLNAGTVLDNKISASIGVQYTKTDNDGRPRVGFNDAIGDAIYNLPITYNINDMKEFKDEFGVQRSLNDQVNNPYWTLNESVFELDRDRLISNVTVQYDPLSFLNITGRIGYDFSSETRFSPTAKGTVNAEDGAFFIDELNQKQFNSDLIVTFSQSLAESLGVKVIAGWNVNQRDLFQFTQRSVQLAAAGVFRPANAQQNITDIFESTRRLMGAFFDVGFEYNDYLFLNVTGRNDWSSTLPRDERSFFYPSVSSSFVFSEAFNLPSEIISFGKLRASWAQVGSDEEPYRLDFLYEPKTSVFFVLSGTAGLAFPFGGQLGFEQPTTIPPQNLKPEIQTSFEFGAELQFLDGRIGLDVGYFDIKTEDQIISLSQSPSSGFNARRINIGATKNTGWEVLLTATPLSLDNFQWDVSANYTRIRQEVISLAPGVEEFNLTGGINGLQVKGRPGEAFGLFGTGFARDSTTGQFLLDAQGLRIQEENVRLGDIYPDFTLGISNTFTYKGVSLSFLLDYRNGGVLYSETVADLRLLGLAEETLNRDQLIVDKGLIEGEGGALVPNTIGVDPEEWWANQDNIEEANTFENTWLKLREARISYRLPRSIVEKTPFGGINVAAEGRNLWLIYSKVPHIDPEQNVFGATDAGAGIEAGGLPSTRSYGFNISLTF